MGGGQGGLDLGVLGVVESSGQPRGEVRLQFAEPLAGDLLGEDAGAGLPGREGAQRLLPFGRSGDHQAALVLVLDVGAELGGEFAPESARVQGEVEFGTGLLVGDEQVSLAGAGGAAGDRAAVDDVDGEPGPRGVVRAGGADDAGSDHHDVRESL